MDLIDAENGSRAPRKAVKTAQESAQQAADTMQVELTSNLALEGYCISVFTLSWRCCGVQSSLAVR